MVWSDAALSVRLATPSGGGLGGRIVRRFSTSRLEISCSICALNSFDARLNSLSALPTWRAISGNFLGPKMTRAKKNRKIVSEKLMRFIILPEPEKRQSLAFTSFFAQATGAGEDASTKFRPIPRFREQLSVLFRVWLGTVCPVNRIREGHAASWIG